MAALATQGAATIGRGMLIRGDIISEEDLYIDGEIHGTLDAVGHCLTVGPAGKVESNIKARELVVFGSVRGNVEASHKVAIRKDGRVVGDIQTAGIVIDDEAYFKGGIDIVKPGERKSDEKAAANE